MLYMYLNVWKIVPPEKDNGRKQSKVLIEIVKSWFSLHISIFSNIELETLL